MTEIDVVPKLWGFCNILRDDGMGYGDYIEQLTYLLFLKIADEVGVEVPKSYDWKSLKQRSGTELTDHYMRLLPRLATEEGMLRKIFAGSQSRFREPVNLKRLISMIDEIQWSDVDVDIKGDAYEGLLMKYAEDQKGAGQYFTPREVIRSVVRRMKPDIRQLKDYTIHDPACGTGGFLIGAYEWMLKQTKMGAELNREELERLQKHTYSGQEIVPGTRRLAFMNLYLHEIEAEIEYDDSLAEGPHTSKRYDCILTNPPFGRAGGGRVERADFAVQTSNKQLNFVQHVLTILKPGGRAAMVVPDNVLFEGGAGKEIRKILLEDCNLHTILRLTVGTFTPYSPGVKANVIFFTKGTSTKETWVYDLRTNTKKITKSSPITPDIFEEFEKCYGSDANGEGKRSEIERFKKITRKEIEEREWNLDISLLRDESLEDSENLPEPEELLVEIETILQSAIDTVAELQNILNNTVEEKEV
jgi:type I restriction enzyme M protein